MEEHGNTITMSDGNCTVTISFNENYIMDAVNHCASALVGMGYAPVTVVRGFREWLAEHSEVYGGTQE